MIKAQRLTNIFRLSAILTVIALCTVLTFEALHSGHEVNCNEENCPVCLVLQIIHSTKKISSSAISAAVEFINFYHIKVILLSALLLVPQTLVKQKVKLVI